MLSRYIDSGQPLGRVIVKPTEHKDLIAKWRQGLKGRRKFENRPFCRRYPFVHDRAIREIDKRHAGRKVRWAR